MPTAVKFADTMVRLCSKCGKRRGQAHSPRRARIQVSRDTLAPGLRSKRSGC
jgi:hypothetical protein